MSDELTNGTYASSGDKVVTYWPTPDAKGDGEDVWEDRYDDSGRSLGRHRIKDQQGRQVKRYKAPTGFEDHRSFDGSENFVKRNPDGTIYRNGNGEAINIRPGEAIVEHADGHMEVLTDEYARFMFARAHEQVNTSNKSLDAPDDDDDDEDQDPPPVAKAVPAKVATPATVRK